MALAVFEDQRSRQGSIVYLGVHGVVLELPKTLEPTAVDPRTLYNGRTKEEVLGERDVLRADVLAEADEPTYDRVAELFPPVRHFHTFGEGEGPHTFVGWTTTTDVVSVDYGLAYCNRINPMAVAPEIGAVIAEERIEEGLVGGWLPVVRMAYQTAPDTLWDTVVFGVVDPPTLFQQPAYHRYLKVVSGRVEVARYFDSFLPYPASENLDADGFYSALYRLHRAWQRELEGAMSIDVPLSWLADFNRHAFALEAISRIGDHPRYGAVLRDYGGPDHDGFQDVFNTAVNSTTEWGLFDRARRYIDNYFTNFVNPDGSIRYRGPEIPQYARMLTTVTRYAEYSGDLGVLSDHRAKLEAIVALLRERLQAGLDLPESDPAYGLVRGRQEADISFLATSLAQVDYEQPYFNNSAETWRGFNDLARGWLTEGRRTGDATLESRAVELRSLADRLKVDFDRAIDLSILTDRGERYLPPIAGSRKYHIDSGYRSGPESFDDNRVWAEMMGSGLLKRDTIATIAEYIGNHHGSTLGIVSNRVQIVVFQAHGQAFGFIQNDMIDEFLLLFYALLAHGYTRGTWSSFECVDLDRDRGGHSGWVAPSQLVVAPMTKWMLVFDDPADDSLWLAKATPTAWLAEGERIAVENAPTRWGEVHLRIDSRIRSRGELLVTVDAPAAPGGTFLRLRLPEGHRIGGVRGAEADLDPVDVATSTIRLPSTGRHELVVDVVPA